jgi:hypothetical protein
VEELDNEKVKLFNQIKLLRNSRDKRMGKVVDLLERREIPFVQAFVEEDSMMFAPGRARPIRDTNEMIDYIKAIKKS